MVFLLLSPLAVPASLLVARDAHGVSPALSPGQWAHYSLSGNQSQGTVDALFTVQKVDGANVTFSHLDTFSNGHTLEDTVSISISTGPTIPSSGQYFVISPQKHVGDSVYPGHSYYATLKLQDLTARPYASASRQVAHIRELNSSQVSASNTPTATFEDFYWDSATGMFTEIVKGQNAVVVLHVVMSSTNLWQPDLPPDPLLIPTAVVSLSGAGLIGVLLVGRYRRKVKLSR